MTLEQLNNTALNTVRNLLDSVYETTGYRTSAEVSCEYLGELNASTRVITRKQQKKGTVPVSLQNRIRGLVRGYLQITSKR